MKLKLQDLLVTRTHADMFFRVEPLSIVQQTFEAPVPNIVSIIGHAY